MIIFPYNYPAARYRYLVLFCIICITLGTRAETTPTLESVTFTPNDSGILVAMTFTPDAPHEFIAYAIMDEKNPILVTEFTHAVPPKKLSANTARPVNHLQILYDAVDTIPLLQTIFYLEKSIPCRYRWHDNQFQIELMWKKPADTPHLRSHLLDITAKAKSDSSVLISFIFDTLVQDKSLSLSIDRQTIIAQFYNTETARDVQPKLSAALLDDYAIIRGIQTANDPFTKVLITTNRAVAVNTSVGENTYTVSATTSLPGTVVSIHDTQKTGAGTQDSAQTQVIMKKSAAHKKWTYIGIGSGIAVGGTVLGIILGKKDEGRKSGTDDIPGIDVDLPQ